MITWTVPATVMRVIDGDTVVLSADLGWNISLQVDVRFFGINAQEHNLPGGQEATDHLRTLLPVGQRVILTSIGVDKYANRTDGVIMYGNVDIGRQMVHDGYAMPWNGKGPRPVPAWPIPIDFVPPPGF